MKNIKLRTLLKKLTYFAALIAFYLLVSYPVAMFAASETPPMYSGYPSEFDEQGVIDATSSDIFVINDSSYPITKDTSFNGPNGTLQWKSFESGETVGIIFTEERSILSLWLLKEKARAKTTHSNDSSANDLKGIHKEGDVWKN
jgi:hypothetical protein